MGDDEISGVYREKLEQNLNELRGSMTGVMDLYTQNLQHYVDSIQGSLNQNEYFTGVDFIKLHQNTKSQTLTQFQSQPGDNEFKASVQSKLDVKIDQKLPAFEAANEEKRQNFMVSTAHSMRARIRQIFFVTNSKIYD